MKSVLKLLQLAVIPAVVVGVASVAMGAAVYNSYVTDDKTNTFFWSMDASHNLGLYSATDALAGAAPTNQFGPYLAFIPNSLHIMAGPTPPVLSTCGTTPAVVGDDKDGQVTMGTGTPTGCVITFAVAYVATPLCVVTWQAQALASQFYAVSNAAITLTQTATSSNKVNYHCAAQSGG